MKKSTLAIFGVFAALFVLVIPLWAIEKEGSAGASPEAVPEEEEGAKTLFATNCGPCHTLAKAGTDGVVGPNLDDILVAGQPEANYDRVISAIDDGVGGRMPADILSGEAAEQVADFVSREAGQ
jgi:mono/diheme cytochrome c family protein